MLRCLVDSEPLLTEVPPLSTKVPASAEAPPPLPLALAANPLPARWTERNLRIVELVLVCLVAFGGSIISSGHSLLFGSISRTGSATAYGWFYSSFREALVLALLWYVLLRRGKSFSGLGLSWKARDVGCSVLLYLGGIIVYGLVYYAIYYAGLTRTTRGDASLRIGRHLFGGGIFATTFLFQFLNPFFEELIVRAYVMTEIKFLTGSASKAVIVSTMLQTSYHFYQGAPAAFAHGTTFLLWSIFYAKTNRIAPVILAHLYSDVLGTLHYGLYHQ